VNAPADAFGIGLDTDLPLDLELALVERAHQKSKR